MQYLPGEEEQVALSFLEEAREEGLKATCERSRCGSVIISRDGEIIGRGYNTPAKNLESQRRCSVEKESYHKKVTDKTCCIHAEQRAIMDAFRKNPDKLIGSRLYFIRLGESGEMTPAGKPYCTICSKMSLDSGVSEFVLWRKEGVCVYDTEEYNLLSYQYTE